MACPGSIFSSVRALTEEGRPVRKAKKTEMKEMNLLSSSDHAPHIPFFLKKVNTS
jgi:hypothetical protein